MTATVMPIPRVQFFDMNGDPLSGGLVYTYAAGTTTPKATYTDSTATVSNTNPVTLDSTGGANIWISGDYKVVLKDSNGVQQWSVDGIEDFHTADNITATSTTSLSISAASKTFTTQTGKYFSVGGFLLAVSDANTANYMHGQITSYSGNQLVVNMTTVGGSGTHADWTISLSGPKGATGSAGGTGGGTGDMLAANNLSDVVSAATSRTNLGLGTAAVKDTGTSAGQIPVLDAGGKYPALDGSQITNLASNSQSVLLGTRTASSSSTLDFTSVISASYDKYEFVFVDLKCSSGGALRVRVSSNNGSSFASSGYDSTLERIGGGSITVSAGTQPESLFSVDGTEYLNGSVHFVGPNGTASYKYFSSILGSKSTGVIYRATVSYTGATSAVNAVRFFPEVGNFTSGKILLYGVKNT